MSLDSKEFRNALGGFATGICVITAAPENEAPFGMTINSFSSVSLDPPLILWSLQNNSECFNAFDSTDRFAVNILSTEQQDLSNRYAKKGDHALADEHFRIGKTGSPVLRGALTTFECKVWARYPGGDHVILVGEVLEMSTRPTGKPLLFHKGKYGEIR